MAEQVQITLFSFDELPEESQQKLIEGFREGYDPDYSHIYDKFITDMSEKYGADIKIDNIQWSGFWSQGDGASFTCSFDDEVLFPILKERLDDTSVSFLEENNVELEAHSIRIQNNYCHENTVRGSVHLHCTHMCELDDDVRNLERMLTEIIREACFDLYQKLEEEYDRAASDEAIVEEIKNAWPGCNFRKDGTIFAR